MTQYINKSVVMADIESYINSFCDRNGYLEDSETNGIAYETLCDLKNLIDTIEIKNENIVSFDMALMLAEEYDFEYIGNKNPHHLYDPKTQELRDVSGISVPKRSEKVRSGMGWSYKSYLAPTFTEAIEYLMGCVDASRWTSHEYDNPSAKIFTLQEENKRLKKENEILKAGK